MADLAFVQQHNMVAYLEKNDGNADFHQILDFLTSSSINFALTTGGSPKKVGDEAINEEMLDSVERAITTDASLDAAQDSDNITKTQSTVTLNEPHPQGEGSGSGPWRHETMRGAPAQTRFERVLEQPIEPPLSEGHTSGSGEGRMEHQFELTANVPITPHDSPLPGGYTPGSDEGRLKLQELMTMCIKLSKQVLDLEKEKDAQAVEILRLKKRVKRLERQRKSSTSQPRRRKYRQVESSDDDLDEEDASKQGRKNDKTNPMLHESDFDGFDDETVDAATTRVSTASALVTTAGVAISTSEPRTPPTTTTVFDDEDVTIAMAQTLIKMKKEKAKEKGVAFKDVEDSSRPVRSITTLQPLLSIDPKDKGKELAHRLHEEELAEIERIQKEKESQEEVSMAAIYEEEQYTIEERAKFLAETIAAQRKFRAAQRAAEIRRLYEREQKFIHDFVPMDSEKEEKKSLEPESEGKKSKRLKRTAGSYATQKSPKKPKVMKSVENVIEEEAAEYEKEKEEFRLSLKIISGDDSEVNYEPLSRIFPIVNWEYKLLGIVDAKDMYVYKLTRADGSLSYHGDMQAFLRRLDRQDLNDLYRLVQERFQDHPLEGHDLLLWGDLRMLFDPDEKDELWMNQLDWKLLKWKLYESCGVHTLFMDGTPMEINMLVEKKYPLIKELLEKMLNLQLEAEEESTMAFELIKFIKSMLEE
ncbi:hypothetical protein Tco_0836109 [Tanacetum coccineum]